MPACLTHYQFARLVLAGIKQEEQENLVERAYYWGAQGPDFLFCHRYFPWMSGKSLKTYGSRIHSANPSPMFDAMRNFLCRHKDPAYRSYVLGFVCHYALDSTAHPYVNALAAELLKDRPYETLSTLHGEVEGALDAIVLRRETGLLPTEVSLKRMFPKDEAIQRRIAKIYQEVLFQVFQENIPEEELLRATNDAHFLFGCLTDRTTLKKRFFEILEKGKPHWVSSHIIPMTENHEIDYANLQRVPWSAGGITSEKDFFELLEDAKEVAHKLISNFDTCDFSELTQEKPFG